MPPHTNFVVRIDVFFDPEVPEVTQAELDAMDHDQTWRDLVEQMKNLTEDQAMDQVHRRFEYKVCPACQKKVLANPLGLRRGSGKQQRN